MKRGALGFVLVIALMSMTASIQAQASYWAQISGWVVDATTGQPVPGAQVDVLTENNGMIVNDVQMRSDEAGYIAFNVDYVTAMLDFAVSAPGYGTVTLQNIPLDPRESEIAFPVILLRAEDYIITQQEIDASGRPYAEIMPPPEYLQGYSQYQRSPQFNGRFWSHDIVPPVIRVGRTGYGHCGYWSNGSYILYPITSVETVDFREYVKGVIPNEWIRTWDAEALKAGAVAAKMYAWWKINIGPRGVWEGQEYDVRGDTCDQVYIPGSQHPSTNDAVDATWGYMLRLEGQVSRLHYTDRVTTCERVNLSPCMGQWDSQYMAEDGADWRTILMAFYAGFEITWSDGTVPSAETGAELVRNGDFTAGTAFWSRSLDTDFAVYDEGESEFLAWKGRTGNSGVINQTLNYALPSGTVIEASLHLGNTSDTAKTVRVSVQRFVNGRTWQEAARCSFTVAPDTPLRRHLLRTPLTSSWANIRLYVEATPADNLPDIITDNVSLRHHTSLNAATKGCFAPGSGWEPTFWDFTMSGTPHFWTVDGGLNTPTVSGAGLQITAAGDNPHLNGPALLNSDATENPYLYIKMASRADECGAVYFTTPGQVNFRESQRVDFTVMPDGIMRQYVVDMSTNPAWAGPINQLRLDPACDDGTGSITIERMMLWDAPTPPQIPELITRAEPAAGATITTAPDALTWEHDPNAAWYHVYLSGAAGMLVNEWHAAETVCTEAVCTLTLPNTPSIENGDYSWWMAAWGWDGMGEYDETTFTLQTLPPGLVSRTAPLTFINTPLTWTDDPAATWYHVYLMRDGQVITDQWLEASTICTDETCTFPAQTFVNGAHSWWMGAWGPGGFGPYDEVTFNVALATPPTPQRFSPADAETVNAGAVTLTWLEPDAAAWYRIYLMTADGFVYDHWVDGNLGCEDGTCTHTVTLSTADYDWWMQAWGPGGFGEWSMTTFTTE